MISVAEGILERVRGLGDQVEVIVHRSRGYSARIESNRILMPSASSEEGVGIRVIVSGSEGFSHSNKVGSFMEVAEAARRIARVSEAKGVTLPTGGGYVEVRNFDPELEAAEPELVVELAKRVLSAASEVSPDVVVDLSTVDLWVAEFAIANSEGVSVSHSSTGVSYAVVAFAKRGGRVSSFDFRQESRSRLGELELEDQVRDLAEQVLMSLDTGRLGEFRGPIMLSPEAFAVFINSVASALSADNVLRGRSPLAGKLGHRAFSESLTIVDDGLRWDSPSSSPADREGAPRSRNTLVEGGVVRTYMHRHYTAMRMNARNTGNASSFSTLPIVAPTNMEVLPGEAGKEELLESVNRTLWVSRLSAMPDHMGNVSGTVKGGWLIEKGEWVRPVREVQISGNVFEALRNVLGVSRERRRVSTHLLPFVLLEGLSVTG